MDADLHLHTRYSDGTFTPEELATAAARSGLRWVALTDHDTTDGCPSMAAACESHGLGFIPGTEITADCKGSEIHLLGYGFDPCHAPLQQRLLHFQEIRRNRILDMLDRLRQRGIHLPLESVVDPATCQSPGRPHVARALVRHGYARTFDAAFERFLKKGRPGWVPKERMAAAEAIHRIHQAGGVAVLAHPGIYPRTDFLTDLVALGLDGLECWHSKHSKEASTRWESQARELGLCPTGGSDCHGPSHGPALVGTVRIPMALVDALLERRPPGVTVPGNWE